MKDQFGYVTKNKNAKGILIAAFVGLICLAAITIGVITMNNRRDTAGTEDVVDLNHVKKNTVPKDGVTEKTADEIQNGEKEEEKDTQQVLQESADVSEQQNEGREEVMDADLPAANQPADSQTADGQTVHVQTQDIPPEEFGTANKVEPAENIPEAEPVTISEEESIAADVAAMVAGYSFDTGDRLEWPVHGNVILDYSMDKTIYFPTLDSYRCNPAIVIQSENGTSVSAGVSGVVKEVASKDEIGNYVVVGIGNGYEVTYGQLEQVNVKAGSVVEPATVIGVVGEVTRYYKKEGPNLYYEVTKDGQPCDPLDYLR